MLKKASITRVPFRKSRLVATLGMVGRWTLRVVVLGLALIGFLHLTRATAVRHVRGVAADGAAISVGEPEFPLMADTLSEILRLHLHDHSLHVGAMACNSDQQLEQERS